MKERTFPSRRAAVRVNDKLFDKLRIGCDLNPYRIFLTQEESSGDLASLFPHLDMEPLSSDERYGTRAVTRILGQSYPPPCLLT